MKGNSQALSTTTRLTGVSTDDLAICKGVLRIQAHQHHFASACNLLYRSQYRACGPRSSWLHASPHSHAPCGSSGRGMMPSPHHAAAAALASIARLLQRSRIKGSGSPATRATYLHRRTAARPELSRIARCSFQTCHAWLQVARLLGKLLEEMWACLLDARDVLKLRPGTATRGSTTPGLRAMRIYVAVMRMGAPVCA